MKTLTETIESLELLSSINWREKAKHADELHYLREYAADLQARKTVIRCKDCKHFSVTTLGMPYACWHGGETVWGETGEHQSHHCCVRVDSPDHFCAYAERRDE